MTLLTACLIVRDGGRQVVQCLASLRDLADEIVVHDTGSRDDTVASARAAGAEVVEGSWSDSFAAARNVALGAASGEWVLSVDADEVVRADPGALRGWLAGVEDSSLLVVIRNLAVDASESYEFTTVRLFRRAGARWEGRVHERPLHDGEPREDLRAVPAELLVVEHSGYADDETRRRKAVRNGRLAALELDDRVNDPASTPQDVARAALHVGRSAIGAGERQRAVDAFEAVRELVPDGAVWKEATDYLARVLLGAGEGELGIVLADQLQMNGVDPRYCSWIRAQGLAQCGRPRQALAQLNGVAQIVDTAGRRHDPAALDALRALCRDLLTTDR